jgi:hypothetical protein
MLTAADLIHLPCTSDLIESGIAFACRSLALTRPGRPPQALPQLRRSVSSVAVDLAFRRFLQGQSIHFNVLAHTPFTDPDRYDLSFDGRRCELITYLISHAKQVSLLCQEPALILQAQALIASDEFTAEYHRADDLYLFAFLLGLGSSSKVENPAGAHPPYWIHLLPREWSRPVHWLPLKPLSFKNDSSDPVSVELGGQDGQHQLLTARIDLPPQGSAAATAPFYSLAYVHVLNHPRGRLVVHSPAVGPAYTISPSGWANLWIEVQDIVMAGWLSHEDFRRRAVFLNIGSPTLQFDRTRVKNRAVPLTRLNSLDSLINKNVTGF